MSAAPEPGSRARVWATKAVQWAPARNGLKYGAHAFAGVRGRLLQATGKVPAIANIYAAGSPKAGSQWMKALFDHPVIRSHTGLFTLPQLYYQDNPEHRFPAGTFVPGIYFSYDEYLRIPKPLQHRLVYMFRDPRELVVSGYFSAVKTHRTLHLEEVEQVRDHIRSLPFDEGLLYLINDAAPRLREIETWVDVDDDAVAKFRLEDVQADPHKQVSRMLEHCGVDLSPTELEAVLGDVSRESLQSQDLAHRQDGESHYRLDRKGFRELFQPEHYAAIEAIVPGLRERLGYPD
jgi:hypothetical protein